MPSKAYLTNKNAIVSRDLRKSQPLSAPDEGLAIEKREIAVAARPLQTAEDVSTKNFCSVRVGSVCCGQTSYIARASSGFGIGPHS